MKRFTPEAQTCLEDYLADVRSAVYGHASVSPNEIEQDVRDHEAALGEGGARVRQRDRRLEPCHVVVGDVADDRLGEALGILERNQPVAAADYWTQGRTRHFIGKRVFRAVLSLGLPRLRATEIAASVGLVLAGGLAVGGLFFFKAPGLVLVSMFVAFAGQMELQALRHANRRSVVVEEVLEPIILPQLPQMEARPYTGVAWDRDRGVWVRWVDGVPVD